MPSTRKVRPLYTDGTEAQEGDRARYHQALGGLMAPGTLNGDRWNYGVVVHRPDGRGDDHWYPDLYLECETGPYAGSICGLSPGHVIEKLD